MSQSPPTDITPVNSSNLANLENEIDLWHDLVHDEREGNIICALPWCKSCHLTLNTDRCYHISCHMLHDACYCGNNVSWARAYEFQHNINCTWFCVDPILYPIYYTPSATLHSIIIVVVVDVDHFLIMWDVVRIRIMSKDMIWGYDMTWFQASQHDIINDIH